MKNKKGMMGNLTAYFAIFIGIVVVAYVFFVLTSSLKTSLVSDYTTTITDANGTSLVYDSESLLISGTVTNGSGNETVASSEYTLSLTANTILFTEAKSNQTGSIKVSGELSSTGNGYISVGNLETGMSNATAQIPQAGTLIGIGVILGVIGMAIYGARKYGLF